MQTRWRVEKIPILKDNFVFVIHDQKTAIVVDPGDASPVIEFLRKNQLTCERILLTHHHADHIGGAEETKEKFHCKVFAPEKNKDQIPMATDWLKDGDSLKLADLEIEVWEVPGHTLGHIAYWLPQQKWLFSGDVLFALGCGRLFEGTPEQMFHTLQRIKSLPDESLIFCTHDYLPANERFCRQENFSIQDYESLLPLILGQEKEFNPFLTAPDVATFAERRQKRNLL